MKKKKNDIGTFFTAPIVISLVIIALIVLMSIFAPIIGPYDPDQMDMLNALQGPSLAHLFGTDQVGRDAVFLSDIGSNTLLITNQCFAEGKTDSNRCQIIKKYVEEGGSLCMIGGYMSFTGIDGTARYGHTEIADVLPVEMLDIDDRVEAPQGLVPELIEEHEAVSGLEGEWPYLLGYNKTITKSDAKTLVKIGEDPLIAIGEYGKGKSAVFTSDCSPHWGSPAFVEWEKYDLLWKDLLDWMTK